ncbi:hypothetical protein LguiB_006937 [Lonicera macranthoides]
MGIVGFLQFALKCVDLFAWPIFALAYPLFASIRAIETNLNHHMRKLVTYWILFSMISLFEHTFDKFIEWFPLWTYIKIVAICWLVLPRFDHSYIAYKSLLLFRSYLNLQVINWSNKQDNEPFLKTQETFLSVAEKFIKENGSEALEELIANKSKVAIPNLGAKEKMAVTVAEKKEMATTIVGTKTDVEQITAPANTEKKEKATKIKVSKPNVDTDEKMAVTITEKKEMASTIESKGAKPDVEEIKAPANTEKKDKATKTKVKHATANLVETERRKAEVVEVKEMNYCPPSSDKVQGQWTCALCQVTTMSEKTLHSHFQGKEHIAKCQELKAKRKTPKKDFSLFMTVKKRRNFTDLGTPLSNAFAALKTTGIVKSRDPPLGSIKVTKGWKPDAYCDYHQTPGHDTDFCYPLRTVIQDLIDSQQINVEDLSRITKSIS